MSEIKHTPGPWEWVGRDLESNFPGHYECVIESTVSCGQFCYGGCVDLKISDADARLIAAAPELLEALQIMVRRIEYYSSLKDDERPNIEQWEYTEGSTDMANARAAIAKATGSQS